ncbi:MAG TPA: cytidine deaminase [Anaerolineae bacterium]|nr:cytidine deaminase [Anaerolineae bacterium]
MGEIDPERLIAAARTAYDRAYAPYSHYQVGAAVLTDAGEIFTGCNVENAVYPLCLCAERVAVTKAISEGAHNLRAVAVVTRNGGTPCGSCRQVLREFGAPELPIFVADVSDHYRTYTLAQLLPDSFTHTDLKQA